MIKKCGQCETDFEAKNINHKYCTRDCQVDHLRGVKPEMSRRRRETGYAWEPVCRAPGVSVKVPRQIILKNFNINKGWKTAVVLPDEQVGYRKYQDGTLDPFHDPRALEIAEKIVEVERPDVSVLLGDLVDAASFGTFRQEPEFAGAVQPGMDRASIHVATVAALSKQTKVIKGNHCARIENYTMDNMAAAAGLRRAKRRKGEAPLLTIDFILGFDEMPNVESIGGYPGGAYYINDHLACIHGRVTGNNLIEKVINSERVSVIMGHIHRYFDGAMTFNQRGAPLWVRAHSSGALCRIDGAVPSTKAGRDPWGKPVKQFENWQQGLAVVRYQEGNGKFVIEHIPIFEGWAMFRGQEFTSDKRVDDPELELIS